MTEVGGTQRTGWQLACLSTDLGSKPLARTIAGTPLVLWRSGDRAVAMHDRCPHRNYPLSKGRIDGGSIVCPYHGWSFKDDGTCSSVPGCSIDESASHRLAARRIGVEEIHGAVFVLLEGDAAFPTFRGPFGEEDFDHFWWDQGDWRSTVFDAIENVMDPFHTSELHHGHIRRRDRRQPVSIVIEDDEHWTEMTIRQSSPDHGIMARMFERDRTHSTSRFDAPARFQGTWHGTKGISLSVTVFFTPTSDGMIRPIACFSTPKGIIPGRIKELVIKGLIDRVVQQDRRALELQAETIAAFESPRYAQGPGDPLGSRIRTLMDGRKLRPGMTEPVEATL